MKANDRVQTPLGAGTVQGFEFRGEHYERVIVQLDDPTRRSVNPPAFFRNEVQAFGAGVPENLGDATENTPLAKLKGALAEQVTDTEAMASAFTNPRALANLDAVSHRFHRPETSRPTLSAAEVPTDAA